jgi:mannan endo-1,4-beta-mannosidase
VTPATAEARRRREDGSRLSLPAGSWLTYKVDQPIRSWQAEFFVVQAGADVGSAIAASWSNDGVDFTPLKLEAEARGAGPVDADYGYLPLLELAISKMPAGASFLRFTAEDEVELARLVIRFGGSATAESRDSKVAPVKKRSGR